jgi:glycosyltransferase involved in cell wall biosynthesis
MASIENKDEYSVSVVIPAYNCGKYIGRAIDSVLAQTRKAGEIIVVNDGSTDSTGEVVKSYGQKVNYIRQENAGASVARNTGIEAATGVWIAFLDGDDEWLENKLELQVQYLSQNPELVWMGANYFRCVCRKDQRARHIEPEKNDAILAGKTYFDSYFDALLQGSEGCTDTMVIKRQCLIDAGLFQPGLLRGNDLDMWWRIAYRWPKFGFITEALAIYHLDIAESLIKKHQGCRFSCDLIERHLKLADEHNNLNRFKPCAIKLLRRWIRGMLFSAQADDIKEMLSRFDELLPPGYKFFIRLLTIFPGTTAVICRIISRIFRVLPISKPLGRSSE